MIFASQVGPRGRGLKFPAARFFFPAAVLLLASACGSRDSNTPDNSARSIVATVDSAATASCTTLPDTLAELTTAQQDRNDLPDTELVLDVACPRATVLFFAGARLPRTYRVQVKSGQTIIARARGEFAPVVLAFDYPPTPRPDGSNVARTVLDSLKVDADREVAIRVMLSPRVRQDPRESQVLLTVLVRP